jgi:macrolide transport system ATP-binding/permease protein
MWIIGVDYHPSVQQIAFVNNDTGECGERRLSHSDGEAEKFYRELKAAGCKVRVRMEATGHARWFERLLAAAIQNDVQSIDKGVAKFHVVTAEQQMEEQTAARRFQTLLLGTFAMIALLLSAVGIYGLMHFFVVQRTNEIGIRMALGARYVSVIALVLRQGLTLAVIGILIGVLGALGITHLLSSLLYGTTATDLVTFTAAPFILLAVAVLACWMPARRATRVDRTVALHQD